MTDSQEGQGTPTEDDAVDGERETATGGKPESTKPGGLGQDGTIPDHPAGVSAGHTGEASTFEPEEDEQAH